jgi:polysaccharide export outer membrane protein
LAFRTWASGVGRSVAIALGLAITLAGCQAVQGDGPWMNGAKSTSTEALPFDVIDLTPTTVVAYRPPEKIDRPSATERLSAGRPLTAQPGDVLSVRIFEEYAGGIFPTIQDPAAGPLGNQIVTDRGTIEVPFVGTVKVAGLGLRQIEHEIEHRLAGKAKGPQVVAEFVADRTNTIMVSGNVKNPGRVSLGEGLRTVLDAINRAGGAVDSTAGAPPPNAAKDDSEDSDDADSSSSSPGGDSAAGGAGGVGAIPKFAPPPSGGPAQLEVVVRRHGNVILDKQLSELLAGGDIGIEKGDEIVVRPNTQVVTVMGAVLVAGNIELTRPVTTLADILGEVHGLFDLRSNKTGLYVFRLGKVRTDPRARAKIFRLDFMQPSSMFVASQFGMQPRDVIFVANAPLVEYDKVLSSLYKTVVIGGVLSGSVTPSVGF